MFANILRLEIAKQRSVLQNVLIGIVLVFLIVLLKSYFGSQTPSDILNAVALVGLVAGIPAFAVLFASSAAAMLRQNRPTEEMLPFSPAARILGAYVTSLLCLLAVALPLFIFGASHGWLNSGLLIAVPAAILYLHFLAFAFSYWMAQPVLGSLIALMISAAQVALWTLIERFLFLLSMEWPDYLLVWFALFCVACLFTGITGMLLLARYIERERPIGSSAGALITVCLLFSVVTSYPAAVWLGNRIQTELNPVFSFSWLFGFQNREDLRAGENLLLAKTIPGALVGIDADGKRSLILKQPEPSLGDFYTGNFGRMFFEDDVYRDSKDRIWILFRPDIQRAPDTFEVWMSEDGQPAQQQTTFSAQDGPWPRALTEIRGAMYVSGQSKSGVAFARLPLSGGPLQWREDERFEDLPVVFAAALASYTGHLARLSEDLRTLVLLDSEGKMNQWDLQGRGMYTLPRATRLVAPLSQGTSFFALPTLRENGDVDIVLCTADGKVRTLWSSAAKLPIDRHSRKLPWKFSRHTIAGGGTAWIKKKADGVGETVYLLSSDLRPFPPLQIGEVREQAGLGPATTNDYLRVDLNRVKGSQLWLTLNGTFMKIDLRNGKLVQKIATIGSLKKPFYHVFLTPAADGLFYSGHDRFYFITWDGKQTDLGPARL